MSGDFRISLPQQGKTGDRDKNELSIEAEYPRERENIISDGEGKTWRRRRNSWPRFKSVPKGREGDDNCFSFLDDIFSEQTLVSARELSHGT